jgi:group II intron reverse transcriptase/maturase
MTETSSSTSISTRLERIATLARKAPTMSFTTLAHHIDVSWLREAYRRTRKDGARGVDGKSADEYAMKLEDNLQSLLVRAKTGAYVAPPVRRVHIPKGGGTDTRPIGIPTFEDKVLQRAVAMVLEGVYEQDFLNCSWGFRPRRSAHSALNVLRNQIMPKGGWILEADIRKFFDHLDHRHLMDLLRRRVRDGVLLRLIGKWLNAGVLENGIMSYPDAGTPQGGVISPLLANIYLHEVLDVWFETAVKPRLNGKAHLCRYADDFVIVFSRRDDAERVMDVLPKRFERYGLKLHPDKTRLLDFRRPLRGDRLRKDTGQPPSAFDFLGFTLHWAKSRQNRGVVKLRTAHRRLSSALKSVRQWCRWHRHDPIQQQHRSLNAKVRGHFGYFGITGNFDQLHAFVWAVEQAWRKWLGRRSQRGRLSNQRWRKFRARYPLPTPRIVHEFLIA